MEALSLDLRERICAACDDGLDTCEEVADCFGVSRSFVQKLLRRRRELGSIAPRPRGRGRKPVIGAVDQRRLRVWVKQKPDTTLAEFCRRLAQASGRAVSVPTMCRAMKALRLPLKKRRCTPANETPRVCGRCAGTSRSGPPLSIPQSWFSWTRAGSTPR